MLLRSAVIVGLVGTALLAGCSNDNGGDGGTTNRLSKAAFVAEANSACQMAKARIADANASIPDDVRDVDPFRAETTADQRMVLAPSTAEVGRIYEELSVQISKFDPPEGDEKKVDGIVSDMRAAATAFRRAAERFAAGSPAGGASPALAVATPGRAMAEYGAGNCATGDA